MWAATTLGSASWSTSFGGSSPSRASTYIRRVDCMPPMPVPCVLAKSAGWTWASSSAGVKPDEMKASTVATRFHAATRSMPETMSAGMPHAVGSNPVGIWPPTTRVSIVRRGTRISVPALRATVHSPSSLCVTTVFSGSSER